MAKPDPSHPTSVKVRNADTGQWVTVQGVGALKGQLPLRKGIDLTKPIAKQAMRDGPAQRK